MPAMLAKFIPFGISLSIYFLFFQPILDYPEESIETAIWTCLPILSLIGVVQSVKGEVDPFRANIGVGLVLSCIADFVQVWRTAFFLPALLLFAGAHYFYLQAFGMEPFGETTHLLAFLSVDVLALAFLVPAIDGVIMSFLVMVYSTLILGMAWRAFSRYQNSPNEYTLAGFAGAVLFVTSDLLIATDMFRFTIPFGSLIFMALYYIGQLGIAYSTLDPALMPPVTAKSPVKSTKSSSVVPEPESKATAPLITIESDVKKEDVIAADEEEVSPSPVPAKMAPVEPATELDLEEVEPVKEESHSTEVEAEVHRAENVPVPAPVPTERPQPPLITIDSHEEPAVEEAPEDKAVIQPVIEKAEPPTVPEVILEPMEVPVKEVAPPAPEKEVPAKSETREEEASILTEIKDSDIPKVAPIPIDAVDFSKEKSTTLADETAPADLSEPTTPSLEEEWDFLKDEEAMLPPTEMLPTQADDAKPVVAPVVLKAQEPPIVPDEKPPAVEAAEVKAQEPPIVPDVKEPPTVEAAEVKAQELAEEKAPIVLDEKPPALVDEKPSLIDIAAPSLVADTKPAVVADVKPFEADIVQPIVEDAESNLKASDTPLVPDVVEKEAGKRAGTGTESVDISESVAVADLVSPLIPGIGKEEPSLHSSKEDSGQKIEAAEPTQSSILDEIKQEIPTQPSSQFEDVLEKLEVAETEALPKEGSTPQSGSEPKAAEAPELMDLDAFLDEELNSDVLDADLVAAAAADPNAPVPPNEEDEEFQKFAEQLMKKKVKPSMMKKMKFNR